VKYLRPDLKILIASRHPESLHSFNHLVTPYQNSVDSDSYNSVLEFVSQVKILINCSGPFREIGVPIVRGCIQRATHYIDITGEVDFMRRIIDEFGAQARIGNVLVIPACGFDSVPSDLGVFFAQSVARAPIRRAECFVSANFSPSRGTLRTLLSVGSDPVRLKVMQDSYALNERFDDVNAPGAAPSQFEADLHNLSYNRKLKKWISPAVMAPINTRVVRRTASLFRSHPHRNVKYHNDFSYQEAAQSSSMIFAVIPVIFTKLFYSLKWFLSLPFFNRIVYWFIPGSGEKGGPSEYQRKRNTFHYNILATTQESDEVEVQVYGGDPYDVTAETVSMAAICIADHEEEILQELGGGGIFTPAFALGQRYLDPLKQSEYIKFEHVKKWTAEQSAAAG